MIAPIIDELAEKYKGKIIFAKLNTDENLQTARKFGITAIPTLLISKNGRIVDRIVGAVPKQEIERRILLHI
jgi:thioredoxin 1